MFYSVGVLKSFIFGFLAFYVLNTWFMILVLFPADRIVLLFSKCLFKRVFIQKGFQPVLSNSSDNDSFTID